MIWYQPEIPLPVLRSDDRFRCQQRVHLVLQSQSDRIGRSRSAGRHFDQTGRIMVLHPGHADCDSNDSRHDLRLQQTRLDQKSIEKHYGKE